MIKLKLLDLILEQHFSDKEYKNLFIYIFFLFQSPISFADNKISFIDVNLIFMNSDAGKKINDQIKDKREKINEEFLTYKKIIEE